MIKPKNPRPEIMVSMKPNDSDAWWKIKTVQLKRIGDTKKISEDFIEYAKKTINTCTMGTTIKVHYNRTLFISQK